MSVDISSSVQISIFVQGPQATGVVMTAMTLFGLWKTERYGGPISPVSALDYSWGGNKLTYIRGEFEPDTFNIGGLPSQFSLTSNL